MTKDDDLSEAVADVRRQWKEANQAADGHVQALRSCGLEGGTSDSSSLPRLNALAQDCLVTLRSLQRQFELLAQQLPSPEERDACLRTLEEWKSQYQVLHSSLRSANLQAKANIQKAAKLERDLLLGGGQESTNLRRNLQTQAGMTAAAESITESLRRTRQMMVQELERGSNTLSTLDESNFTLKKAETEYKGQRSLLMTTRHLLTVMKRQDVLDRVILVVGFIFFSLVVSYVFHQRIGTFKMMRRASQLVPGFREEVHISSSVAIDMSHMPPAKAAQLQPSPDIKMHETLSSTQEEPDTAFLAGTPSIVNSPDSSPSKHVEL